MVLERVLFMETLNSSTRSNLLNLRRFSLTRSKITTVSLIEYPAIVKIAAILDKLKSQKILAKSVYESNCLNSPQALEFYENKIDSLPVG